jgi:hypothetical protein
MPGRLRLRRRKLEEIAHETSNPAVRGLCLPGPGSALAQTTPAPPQPRAVTRTMYVQNTELFAAQPRQLERRPSIVLPGAFGWRESSGLEHDHRVRQADGIVDVMRDVDCRSWDTC